MTSPIGSVFLGDVQRLRILSTSTPPSSPPPSLSPSGTMHFPESMSINTSHATDSSRPKSPPPPVTPKLSLDLRVRWLETLIYGAKQDVKARIQESNYPALMKGVQDLQKRLDDIVQHNEGLRRFMEQYEQHAHLLTPAFALSGTIPTAPPSYENMSPSELEAFLAEMEQDIRAADRDLREIELLEKKDVTAAGKLPDYEKLKPRLEQLLKSHEEDRKLAADLERRVAALIDRYARHVDTLSELFVAWDDTIEEAEDQVHKLEKDHEERRRLGYD
ncbi:hypothetical protein K474DRAFT_1653315 [Panus rudis PR-1116 ss-1]|nr:hypothetical protein K474DRAFT_1653315 [Panus rudis PR-1116 ss-1]